MLTLVVQWVMIEVLKAQDRITHAQASAAPPSHLQSPQSSRKSKARNWIATRSEYNYISLQFIDLEHVCKHWQTSMENQVISTCQCMCISQQHSSGKWQPGGRQRRGRRHERGRGGLILARPLIRELHFVWTPTGLIHWPNTVSYIDLWPVAMLLCWNLLFHLPRLLIGLIPWFLLYLSDSHSCIRPFPLMLIPLIPSLSTTSLCCRVSHCRLLFDALDHLVRDLSHQSRSFASFPFFHRPVAVPVSDSLHFIWHMKKNRHPSNPAISLDAWHLCRVLRL